MRARLVLVLASATLFCGAFAIQACGGGDTENTDTPDASEAGAQREASFDAPEPPPLCDPKGDLLRKVKDASIGDGASTTGICLGCAKTKCPEAIANCAADCPCQRIVSDAIECYLTTQQIGCAVDLADILVTPKTRKSALGVLGCVREQCPQECAVEDAGTPDPDSGAPDAADAADAADGGG